MIKYEFTKEWLLQHGEMIKRAYGIAQVNNWDTSSKEVALELLKVVDPENASKENAALFSKILQLFEARLKKTKNEEKDIEKLIN